MASVGKAAAFAAMLRVLVITLPFQRDDWRPAIWALAVLSLVVGAVLAVVQTDVKRMLAYSSISHAGFILVGVVAAGHNTLGDGMPSVVEYLLIYSVLTVGSFAVVALVAEQNGGDTSIDAFKGLAKRRPAVALAFTVFLLAQAGVPFTSGFVAKWGVIMAAVEESSYVLGVIAMLAAVIAAFMYLRIMVNAWLADDDEIEREMVPFATGLAILLAAAFTIVIGIYPEPLIEAADSVTQFAR
jgi:NADH-quinone oxidoreductase subunit N